jgi:signal peptidase II
MTDPARPETGDEKHFGKGILYLSSALAFFFYVLDQITKEIIVRVLPLSAREIIIPGFFNLTSVRNPGAAWGIFAGKQWFLLIVSFAALLGIIFFFRKLTNYYSERVFALALLVSGILGNCTDRLLRKEVVDFLEFHLGKFYWPSFNVADICITGGVILYVLSSLIRPESEEK